ncbi:galaxin [Elysia marginata]|uniref:Galaxin n=1 Tax=Elysia marginata TaxID=1093978 RepID=A0AAV4GEJ9_9GAST|nr:galaxin [Elysia marginata]
MISSRLIHQECCDNKIIDTRESVCCGDKVKPRFVISSTDGKQKEQSCCGSDVIFDGESKICCDGSPVKLTEEQNFNRDHFLCCSKGILADVRKEECCGEKVLSFDSNFSCCGGQIFNTSSHKCEDNFGQKVILRYDQDLCDDDIYTVTQKSCCYGVLNDTIPERNPLDIRQRNSHFSCCETKVIDPEEEVCCWEHETGFKTHSIPKGFKCCGDSFYDTSCQACSNGSVIERGLNQAACGSSIINTSDEGCCANHLRYNRTLQQCCLGSQSNVIAINQKCCNGAGYTEDELCCVNTKPCRKRRQDDNDCCFNEITNELQTFNNLTEKCQEGRVFVVPLNREVCGNEEYNPETHLCCKGEGRTNYKLYKIGNRTSGYNQCCRSMPFNNHSQTCCFGRVFEIPAKKALCCPINYKAYNYHDTSSPCTRKCVSSYYDVNKETCCDGVVHLKRRRFTCCGPFYFRSKSKHNNGKKGKRPRSIDCCGMKEIFSRKTSECLNGKVLPTPKLRNLTDTQGICHRPLYRSIDGVVKHVCTSQHALVGKLRVKRPRPTANPGIAIVEMTLIRPSTLPIRHGHRVGQRNVKLRGKLKFRVLITMNPEIDCYHDLKRNMKKVSVFFNAPIRRRIVNINAKDSFRIVKFKTLQRLLKYGGNKAFCDQRYSSIRKTLSEQDQFIQS